MKHKQTLRRSVIISAGILFAVYAAYNVFIIIRDGEMLPAGGALISALVALLFGVLAVFALTSAASASAVKSVAAPASAKSSGKSIVKKVRFIEVRSMAFNVALLMIFLLKLRMAGQVTAYLDFTQIHTVLYSIAYLMTQIALLALFVNYAFVQKNLPFYPRASAILPLSALILFVCSFALEVILFFVYGIGLEASQLRTLVIRPVFYLGFICLSAYFYLRR